MARYVRVPVLEHRDGTVVIDFAVSMFRYSSFAGGPCSACEGEGLVDEEADDGIVDKVVCTTCGGTGCDNVQAEAS